jgi:hypothetical protein
LGAQDFQDPKNVVNVIYGGDGGFPSKRAKKLTLREILSVEPGIQKPLRYSEVPISFCRDDQWTSFSELGKLPLVLDHVVAGSQLTRVLIYSGSGLNLLFASTLKKMGLDISKMLAPSRAPFYGIVPGNAAIPLGSVVLPVTFGTKDNYCTEYIKFEVANFKSSYYAILGKPALAKFVALPHYVYLLLKMPGKTGVLTLRGDLRKLYTATKRQLSMPRHHACQNLHRKFLWPCKNSPTRRWRSPARGLASRGLNPTPATSASRPSSCKKATRPRLL